MRKIIISLLFVFLSACSFNKHIQPVELSHDICLQMVRANENGRIYLIHCQNIERSFSVPVELPETKELIISHSSPKSIDASHAFRVPTGISKIGDSVRMKEFNCFQIVEQKDGSINFVGCKFEER